MPTFFIASGYLFREKNIDSPRKYVKRKVKGLWWPFMFWSLAYLSLHNIFAYFNIYQASLSVTETLKLIPRYAIMAGTEQLLGGFWFLSALLFATIAGFFYYKWIGFSNKVIIAGIVVMLAGAEVLCYFGINHYTIHLNPRDFMAVAYFMTGTLIARIDNNVISRYRTHLITTAIIFLALQTTFMPASIDSLTVKSVVPFYVTSSLAGFSLIQLCHTVKTLPFARIIAKIGVRTIDVLIFHFLIFKLVSWVYLAAEGQQMARLAEFPVLDKTNDWLWIVYTIVAVVLSYLIGQLLIKIKLRSKLLAAIMP